MRLRRAPPLLQPDTGTGEGEQTNEYAFPCRVAQRLSRMTVVFGQSHIVELPVALRRAFSFPQFLSYLQFPLDFRERRERREIKELEIWSFHHAND